MDIRIFRKGTTTNKLTIAKDRIELKVTDQVSPESEKWLLAFVKRVVEDLTKAPVEFTLRGRFYWNERDQKMTLGLGVGPRAQKIVAYFYSDQMGLSLPAEDLR